MTQHTDTSALVLDVNNKAYFSADPPSKILDPTVCGNIKPFVVNCDLSDSILASCKGLM